MARVSTGIGAIVAGAGVMSAMPGTALARVTVSGPFGSGFTEPVWAVAHLVGLLAIGIWAGQNGGRAVWQVPVAAMVGALAAGMAAQYGLRLPFAAEALTVSLITAGGLVALALRVPALVTTVLVLLMAAGHGYIQAGGALFWAGFLSGVALVTCAGLGLCGVIGQLFSGQVLRLCGGAVALFGLLDFAGIL